MNAEKNNKPGAAAVFAAVMKKEAEASDMPEYFDPLVNENDGTQMTYSYEAREAAARQAEEQAFKEGTAFCTACGARLMPDYCFCAECGSPVRTVEQAEAAAPPAPPVVPEVKKPGKTKLQGAPTGNGGNKKSKTGLIIGIAAGALCLLLGILAIAGVFGGKSSDNPDPVVNFTDPAFDSAFRNKYGYNGVTIHESDLLGFTELDLNSCGLTNIADVARFKNLTWLYLEGNNIGNISPLTGLTKLTFLGLGRNSISNISPLAGLTKLTELELGGNSISNISPLAGLTKLTGLGLSGNGIGNISPLAGLTNLTVLDLHYNSIGNISPLAGLTKLTKLWLSDNNISDISPLAWLTNLTMLYLENNSISNISPLAGLTRLTWLVLGGNPLTDEQIAWLRQQLPNCDIWF